MYIYMYIYIYVYIYLIYVAACLVEAWPFFSSIFAPPGTGPPGICPNGIWPEVSTGCRCGTTDRNHGWLSKILKFDICKTYM